MAWRTDLTVDDRTAIQQGYGYDSVKGTVADDDQRSGAVRSALEDATFDRSTLYSNISSLITQLGGREHPDHSGLVLQSIGGTLGEGEPAQYDVVYAPKKVSGYRIEGDIEELRWYEDPGGAKIPRDASPPYRIRRIPIQIYEFSHRFYQLAQPDISASVDTVNDAQYNLTVSLPDGTTDNVLIAPAKTLLYAMPSLSQTIMGNTSVWVKSYRFAYRADTWIGQRRLADDTIENYDMYDTSSFPTIPFGHT